MNVKADNIVYNDIVPYISEVLCAMKQIDFTDALNLIQSVIDKYKLDKYNEDGFKRLRQDYNSGNNQWYMFYTLVCYSFNNQYRFNNKHEYNSSFGKYKSCFSKVTKGKLEKAMKRLHEIDIEFIHKDFREIDYSIIGKDDFVYFDPPYLITTGNYNDGKRGFTGWNKGSDIELMKICDNLDENNIKFAMSNMLVSNDKTNDELVNWSKKYIVHNINVSYGNCNYHKLNKSNNSTEVLITNY